MLEEYKNIQPVAYKILSNSIASGKYSHAYLFETNGYENGLDMAICFAQTKRQAKEFGNTVSAEIKKLVIHSMLHLMGYDHIKDDDYEVMNKKEIELDKKINLEAI